MATYSDNRGDTLVEVLLAMAILSVMIIGSSIIMSRGLDASQTALEHTQVRNGINTQAELLRYIRDSYVKDPNSTSGQEWNRLLTTTVPTPYVSATAIAYDDTCVPTKRAFYLAKTILSTTPAVVTDFNSLLKPPTHAVAGQGMWIEAVSSVTPSGANYIDFQIRACWTALGGALQQTGTVVRLYDAR